MYAAHRRAPRRYSRRGRSYAPRRTGVWVRNITILTGPIASLTGVGLVDLLPDLSVDPGARVGSTITRVRGTLNVIFDMPPTPALNAGLGVLAGVVGPVGWRTNTPPNVPPSPMNAPNDHDWFGFDTFAYNGAGNLGIATTPGAYARAFDFDFKAQRRLVNTTDTGFLLLSGYAPISSAVLIHSTYLKLS